MFRSGLRRFPPRLPEQPIFYPVLERNYAEQIAQDWNTKSGSRAGYVTEFEIDDAYASSFSVHQVGARMHRELWVPAEAIDEFNAHIVGLVRLVDAFFGPDFAGIIPTSFSLRGKDARGQMQALSEIYRYNSMDFHGEITANHEIVFAHFPFWERLVAAGAQDRGVEGHELLTAIEKVWTGAFPTLPLGVHQEARRR